ncbi:MAG TPA: antibiotic biosynthesis monooxygenase [Candidatus Limnocylindrales bacterium]|nr:antibiotic biosynthesis monooxygenase [Candidatus Limnocylindrales bacterium]
MGQFVHVVIVTLKPEATAALVEDVREVMESVSVKLPGFVGSVLLVSDDQTRISVVSIWSDRHSWAQAQWEDRIQDAMVELFKAADNVESQSYNEVARYVMR